MAEKKQDNPEKAVAASASDVQAKVDEANERGFFGERVDETPRENYTVDGVTSGKPTPESTELEKQ